MARASYFSSFPPRKLATRAKTGLLLALFLVSWSAGKSVAAPEPETFFSFLTNCPPIKDVTLEVQYFSTQAVTCAFRYQAGAFYARQLTDGGSKLPLFTTAKDTTCGNWEDEYWFLQPPPALPAGSKRPRKRTPFILHTGLATGSDREGLLAKNHSFGMAFNYFASFGLTSEGVNSLRMDGERAVSIQPSDMGRTISVSFTMSNELPVAAHIQPTNPKGPAKPINVRYRYKPDVIPLPVPHEIVVTQKVPKPGDPESTDPSESGVTKVLLRMTVKKLELGDRSSPLPASLFKPDRELSSNAVQVVFTNRQNFQLQGGVLIGMSKPKAEAEKELKQGLVLSREERAKRNRKQPIVIMILIISLVALPLAVILIQNKKQKQNPMP